MALASLTSIKLCENHIGLPGIKSLCKHLNENATLAELSLRGRVLYIADYSYSAIYSQL